MRAFGVLMVSAIFVLAACNHEPDAPPPGGNGVLAITASPPVVVNGTGVTGGSAWVYDAPRGLIVTAYHVLNGRPQVVVGLHSQQQADVLAAAPCEDIALMRVKSMGGLETMRLGSEQDLTVGQHLSATGYPAVEARDRTTVSGSVITAHAPLPPRLQGRDFPPLSDLLEIDGRIAPGLSGGAVIDDAGRLVGMNVLSDQVHTIAVGVDQLARVVRDLARKRSSGWIGRSVSFRPGLDGPLVSGLDPHGEYDAANAVMVTAVNGVPVKPTFTSWCHAVAKLRAKHARITYSQRPGTAMRTRTFRINPSPEVEVMLNAPTATSPLPPTPRPDPAVIRIESQAGGTTTPGSGWLVDKRQALAVTSFDVVSGTGVVRVVQPGGDTLWDADVVAASPCEGVAMLRLIDSEHMRPLQFAPSDRLAEGARVRSLGFYNGGTVGNPWNVMRGRVVASHRPLPPLPDTLQATPIYDDGKIGGPVVDEKHRVVGMLAFEDHLGPTAKATSIAIGSDRLLAVLKLFRRGIAPGRIGRGISFEEEATHGERGVAVSGLDRVYGSYGNGGVLVTAVNGHKVGRTLAAWCKAIAPLGPQRARITYREYPGSRTKTVVRTVNGVRPR